MLLDVDDLTRSLALYHLRENLVPFFAVRACMDSDVEGAPGV